MTGGLDDALKRFIAGHISSVEQLEILLTLKTEPEKHWEPEELSRRLYTTVESVTNRIRALEEKALVAGEKGRYRFAANAGETRALVENLAEAYARRKVAVINEIFSGPSEEVQSFADAFKLRKDDS